ncbi:hypothetical protein CLOLEP_01077 [[Clostridium] leptum DSM 753]|uniref:Uncharacterized protein n=1 Tax=[Clostridium] leptum DSM 753 TaxID=428125 RepID=A7VR95_9FIRM|nr:hypothetical protein CLOLEP_01077 [[Clostridium] leptum DSM 753]
MFSKIGVSTKKSPSFVKEGDKIRHFYFLRDYFPAA